MSDKESVTSWIEASVFVPVLKETIRGFKQIKNFKAKRALEAGENYGSVVFHLNIEIELDDGSAKSLSYILKTAHETAKSSDALMTQNFFDNETTIYKEILPEFERLYKEAGVDVTFGPKYYELLTSYPNILLEDLRVRDFKNQNRIEGLDREHAQAVLKKLAQWHAASAVRVAVKGPFEQNLLQGFYKEEKREQMTSCYANFLTTFLEVNQQFEGDEQYFNNMCIAQKNFIDIMFRCNKVNANEFNVLNHGDCWSNNIMFQHDAFDKVKETYFIGFQRPKYGPPAKDLYYFLLSSTKYDIKIKQFDYFIKYYHEQLEEHLKLLNYTKKVPALKDIHIMMYRYGIYGYITATTIMPLALLEGEDTATAENFCLNTEAGTQFQKNVMSSPIYRHHMKLVLPWLYNRGAF